MTRTPSVIPRLPRHPIRSRQSLLINRRRMPRAMRRRPIHHRTPVPILLIRMIDLCRVVQEHDGRLGRVDWDGAGVGRGVAGEDGDVEGAFEGAVDGELGTEGLACPGDIVAAGNGGGVEVPFVTYVIIRGWREKEAHHVLDINLTRHRPPIDRKRADDIMRSGRIVQKVDEHQLVELPVVVDGIGRAVRPVVGRVDDLGHV